MARPRKSFWKDPDRFIIAFALFNIKLGFSNKEAISNAVDVFYQTANCKMQNWGNTEYLPAQEQFGNEYATKESACRRIRGKLNNHKIYKKRGTRALQIKTHFPTTSTQLITEGEWIGTMSEMLFTLETNKNPREQAVALRILKNHGFPVNTNHDALPESVRFFEKTIKDNIFHHPLTVISGIKDTKPALKNSYKQMINRLKTKT